MSQGITLDACTDTARLVAEALRATGCVLLRNAFPREPVLLAGEAVQANARRLAEIVGHEVNDMPLCFSEQYCPDPEVKGLWGRSLADFTDPLTFSGMTPAWFYEGDRNYKRMFWENGASFPNLILGLVTRSLLPDVYYMVYSGRVICSYAHCSVRYQRSDIRHKSYAFHQDASYHSRGSGDHVGLTTWIPLTECGTDAPGLQLYPQALEEVLPPPDGIEGAHLFCDTQTVLERYGDRLWAPKFSAGDVLIFNHFVVHRTYITGGMTKERQSVDFRVFPRERIPDYVLNDRGWIFDLPKSDSMG